MTPLNQDGSSIFDKEDMFERRTTLSTGTVVIQRLFIHDEWHLLTEGSVGMTEAEQDEFFSRYDTTWSDALRNMKTLMRRKATKIETKKAKAGKIHRITKIMLLDALHAKAKKKALTPESALAAVLSVIRSVDLDEQRMRNVLRKIAERDLEKIHDILNSIHDKIAKRIY